MAEARHRGAAGGVEIILAAGIADKDALPADRDRIFVADLPMKDMSHGYTGVFLGERM